MKVTIIIIIYYSDYRIYIILDIFMCSYGFVGTHFEAMGLKLHCLNFGVVIKDLLENCQPIPAYLIARSSTNTGLSY